MNITDQAMTPIPYDMCLPGRVTRYARLCPDYVMELRVGNMSEGPTSIPIVHDEVWHCDIELIVCSNCLSVAAIPKTLDGPLKKWCLSCERAFRRGPLSYRRYRPDFIQLLHWY